MLAAPIVSVRSLTKTFTLHAVGGRVVESLHRVDFEQAVGEHVAIAGSSGAGKSSLLRCIYRNYLPDSGTILLHTAEGPIELTALDDRAMARERGRSFGYVSQFLSAPPRTGPLALVVAAARRRGFDTAAAREAAVDSLRALAVDEALWDVDCGLLSGGERQRVNLAAGTVIAPRLLLLDEPVSALDPANRERALDVIDGLVAGGVSVLAVYHDMDVIRERAHRVIVMRHGRITADGTPQAVLGEHDTFGNGGDAR